MNQRTRAILLIVLLTSFAVTAQSYPISPSPETNREASEHAPWFVDPTQLDLTLLLPLPPAQNSEATKSELMELHRIEERRTQPQVLLAQVDDKEQDIFLFKDMLGQNFTASSLPLTAVLSTHIHEDESIVTRPIKAQFSRPRPFQADNTLHPVCMLSQKPDSYPSGHSLSGYLLALTLVQIVPEKREQIMQRADNYAHNRMVCGVHYASDVEASRTIAYAMFGYMLASPRFQKELAAAKAETRSRLSLPVAAPDSRTH
jgi:acid phosphatase (class A)